MKIDNYTYPRIVEQLVHLWSWDRKALIVMLGMTAPYSTLHTLIFKVLVIVHLVFSTGVLRPSHILVLKSFRKVYLLSFMFL